MIVGGDPVGRTLLPFEIAPLKMLRFLHVL